MPHLKPACQPTLHALLIVYPNGLLVYCLEQLTCNALMSLQLLPGSCLSPFSTLHKKHLESSAAIVPSDLTTHSRALYSHNKYVEGERDWAIYEIACNVTKLANACDYHLSENGPNIICFGVIMRMWK